MKDIITGVLRGFLLLENCALTGSDECLFLKILANNHDYSHISNALREPRGNDERLRSHDVALSRQL